MRSVKPLRSEPTGQTPEFEDDDQEFGEDPADVALYRVVCPDCSRPIALGGLGEPLPQHALCPTPWNPFGLTICPGSGRLAEEDGLTPVPLATIGPESAASAALPEGLDWRLQPFSHATGPGSRPAAVPPLERAA
ncbi:hypothetical protein E1265_11890 [Streptomyces sp. 8K308]|uniref:hypothetical protein n=1 Tax=Streptomyces sp. 8K308 TaxID=2530388 RepID=UPI00105381A6|nr:hypothetical protein [Streptomyces sp. 8K308]TDC23757.1 hypothetical protein E1265_11890 [Streptomyces sp. 8K308]